LRGPDQRQMRRVLPAALIDASGPLCVDPGAAPIEEYR
jgi:hypothetical protein